jgi:Tfp pilus assembly protein PilF
MPSIKPRLGIAFAAALLLGGCSGIPLPDLNKAPPSETGAAVSAPIQRAYAEALSSLRQGETKRAKRQFESLAAENPELAGPQTNLGIIQLRESDPAAAEQSFRKALKNNPASAKAHNQLGIALRMQGRFQEAEQSYQAALKIEPVYRLAHRNLGILYDLYLSKPDKALEQYRLCQKLATAPDPEIEGWIADLERRVKGGK